MKITLRSSIRNRNKNRNRSTNHKKMSKKNTKTTIVINLLVTKKMNTNLRKVVVMRTHSQIDFITISF